MKDVTLEKTQRQRVLPIAWYTTSSISAEPPQE
jgi:hypothetical protein